MQRILLVSLFVLLVPPVDAQERPKNVILMIADGAGPSAPALARRVLERPLALDSYLTGSVATTSTSHEITDSAAAATAFACGLRTFKGAIAVDSTHMPCRTVLEAAEARGMVTGLVTTAPMTDATPAAFAAHAEARADHESIASQMMDQGIEVLLGGGRQRFLPVPEGTREDGRNLIEEARGLGYNVIAEPDELETTAAPLLGLFADGFMDFEIDRIPDEEPSLLEMTHKALELLSNSAEGFFLLIETEGTDDAGHRNDGAALAREIDSFDGVFKAVVEFAVADGHTLVVASSDHDTGGLGVGINGSYNWQPEVLRSVSRSATGMAQGVADGEDPQAVFESTTGIGDLSEPERAQIGAADSYRDYRSVFGSIVSARAGITWSTTGHTEADVPIYSFGPGSELFRGHMGNDEVGRRLFEVLGL